MQFRGYFCTRITETTFRITQNSFLNTHSIMKHSTIIRHFILIAAITLLGYSQADAQILWKISGNGIKDSYVLGTHHVAPTTILDGIAGFNDAFASCQQLYGEIDMESATQEMMINAQKYMMAPADSTMSKVFSTEDMKLVDAATQKYMRLPAAQFDMLKPAALSTQIAVMQAAKVFTDFDPTKQIDATLQQRAKERKMAVKGFESFEFQMQMLFNTPISYQAAELLKMVKDETQYMEYTRLLADIYSQQDLDAMFELMNNPELGITEYELDTMIYDRNAAWLEQLKEILPTAPTFIVVGAGHLPGDKGLLSLLRKAGYTVTPVN